MSQSPLARSTRRSLPAFAHPPSRLSKSTSVQNLRSRLAHEEVNEEEDEDESETPDESSPAPKPAPARKSTPRASTGTRTHTPTTTRYKDASSSTPTGSSSPKIVYSPYATNSPHAGPSRSSSIPFDMAASAKDNRRKSMGVSMGRRDSTPGPGPGAGGGDSEREGTPVPAPKRRAIIRKKPLTTRIFEYPQSLIDRFQYDLPQSILDVLPDAHLANPIALALHVLHYLLLAPLFPGQTELGSVLRGREKGRWERFEDEHAARGRSIAGGMTSVVITLVMLLVTVGNAAYLFSRFKTYDMQLRSASDPVHSPHASPAPAPKIKQQDSDVFTSSDPTATATKNTHKLDAKKIAMIAGRGLWITAKFLFAASMSAIGKPTQHASTTGGGAGGGDRIQTLRVWEPPAFCLAFFCAIPPTAPLLTHILSSLHPLLTPLIHLSTAFLLSHLATSFAQLVKDRMFLSAEVMREYDQRFVYKKVFSSRVDRGVMTNEAELVW